MASARSFAVLMAAFVAFYPASGAFVSLTQAEIMDAWPDRQAQVMVRWDLAGAIGAVAGPLLLTAVLAADGSWRAGYLVLAGIGAVVWLGALLRGQPEADGRAERRRTAGRRRRRTAGRRRRRTAGRRRRTRRSSRGRRGPGRPVPRCGTGGRCAGCC